MTDDGAHREIISLRDYFEAVHHADQRRLDERFKAQERALNLQTGELARRLEELNHAHQQARDKERDFVGREAFETHVLRNQDDHAQQRRDVAETARVLAAKVEETAQVTNARLSAVESFVQKVLGLTLSIPFVTALVVYLLTK